MKIKCPYCGCEYEPSWNDDASTCPFCKKSGYSVLTSNNTKEVKY